MVKTDKLDNAIKQFKKENRAHLLKMRKSLREQDRVIKKIKKQLERLDESGRASALRYKAWCDRKAKSDD